MQYSVTGPTKSYRVFQTSQTSIKGVVLRPYVIVLLHNKRDAIVLQKRDQIPSNFENKPQGLYFSKALFEGLNMFVGAYIILFEVRVNQMPRYENL